MKGHLRLHFSSAETSDEAVLSVYPTTIRRRILRHLYIKALSSCWLFERCKLKLLDAVLAASKVELYMPKVRRLVTILEKSTKPWLTGAQYSVVLFNTVAYVSSHNQAQLSSFQSSFSLGPFLDSCSPTVNQMLVKGYQP